MLCFTRHGRRMISRTYLVCITLVAVACIVVAAATVPDDDFLLIIYDLSVGFFLSAVFYVIVVHLPERNRRRIVHAGLKEQYDQFRRSCIHIFLTGYALPNSRHGITKRSSGVLFLLPGVKINQVCISFRLMNSFSFARSSLGLDATYQLIWCEIL